MASAPDTIRFHRYERCVLLGRSQIAADAVDRDYCRRRGIAIAHRVTGGGAVYMSPEMLAWDVVVERRMFGGDLDLADPSDLRGRCRRALPSWVRCPLPAGQRHRVRRAEGIGFERLQRGPQHRAAGNGADRG